MSAPIEPTDEQVERMARSIHSRSAEGRSGFSWPVNGEWGRERDLKYARQSLTYILNGPKPPDLSTTEPKAKD